MPIVPLLAVYRPKPALIALVVVENVCQYHRNCQNLKTNRTETQLKAHFLLEEYFGIFVWIWFQFQLHAKTYRTA